MSYLKRIYYVEPLGQLAGIALGVEKELATSFSLLNLYHCLIWIEIQLRNISELVASRGDYFRRDGYFQRGLISGC